MADAGIGKAVDGAEDYREPIVETVKRLAALSPAEYESVRKEEAKKLGWRTTALDREVAAMRPKDDEGNDLGLFEPDPWPEKVDGDELLDLIVAAIRHHVVLSSEAAEAVALWVVHTFTFETWQHTPRLSVTAPERGCGKSLLLDVIACLVPRALLTDSLSEAVAFRLAEEAKPVFLIDECDSHLSSKNPDDGLRGILNSGHAKGKRALRCVGDDNKVKGFNTFTPVAMAGIGDLPQTLADRSLQVWLQKKLASERVQPFRSDRIGHLRDLAAQAARWASDNKSALRETDPEMPSNVYNRRADVWRALLAIADVAGSDWPERARLAATKLEGAIGDTETIDVTLLIDIQAAFEIHGDDKMASAKLAEYLHEMEDRPWPEYGRARKPITPVQIANRLRHFKISPGTIWLGDGAGTAKGYQRSKFENVFERYIPPSRSVRPSGTAETVAFDENQSVRRDPNLTDRKSPKPAETASPDGLTDRNPPEGSYASFEGLEPDPMSDEEARMEAEERAAIQQFDAKTEEEAKAEMLRIPDWMDKREPKPTTA